MENVPFADEYDNMIDRFAPQKPLFLGQQLGQNNAFGIAGQY